MKVYSHSEVGNHAANEDAISVIYHKEDSSILICALADGQGGRTGGAVAAQQAVSSCLKKAQTFSSSDLLKPFTWLEIGEYVDKYVCSLPDAGYTTFVGMSFVNSFVVGVSCGDSAAVLLMNGRLIMLTEAQHKNPPIGSGGARLTPFSAKLDGEWKLLMISDGVWKYIGWDLLERRFLFETSDKLISSLLDEVVSSNKMLVDDFSAILIES